MGETAYNSKFINPDGPTPLEYTNTDTYTQHPIADYDIHSTQLDKLKIEASTHMSRPPNQIDGNDQAHEITPTHIVEETCVDRNELESNEVPNNHIIGSESTEYTHTSKPLFKVSSELHQPKSNSINLVINSHNSESTRRSSDSLSDYKNTRTPSSVNNSSEKSIPIEQAIPFLENAIKDINNECNILREKLKISSQYSSQFSDQDVLEHLLHNIHSHKSPYLENHSLVYNNLNYPNTLPEHRPNNLFQKTYYDRGYQPNSHYSYNYTLSTHPSNTHSPQNSHTQPSSTLYEGYTEKSSPRTLSPQSNALVNPFNQCQKPACKEQIGSPRSLYSISSSRITKPDEIATPIEDVDTYEHSELSNRPIHTFRNPHLPHPSLKSQPYSKVKSSDKVSQHFQPLTTQSNIDKERIVNYDPTPLYYPDPEVRTNYLDGDSRTNFSSPRNRVNLNKGHDPKNHIYQHRSHQNDSSGNIYTEYPNINRNLGPRELDNHSRLIYSSPRYQSSLRHGSSINSKLHNYKPAYNHLDMHTGVNSQNKGRPIYPQTSVAHQTRSSENTKSQGFFSRLLQGLSLFSSDEPLKENPQPRQRHLSNCKNYHHPQKRSQTSRDINYSNIYHPHCDYDQNEQPPSEDSDSNLILGMGLWGA